MNKVIKFIKQKRYLIYCLLVAIVILSITSKNSFLYELNDWVDANAFFTVGKSMMNNVVPYRDIFEQKGILLYFIYGIGYLLSNKTFHGVFILEVIGFSVFLYYIHKIISLFLKKSYTYVLVPFMAFLVTCSTAFTHGGSAEEMCLPMLAITLYYFLRHFKDKKINNKELVLNGLLAGCVLLIKYTFLGFWFAFMMFIFFDYVRHKQYLESFKKCLWFLLGMISPIVIFMFYFIATNSLKDFIDCYFVINMTAYNETELSIIAKIGTIFQGMSESLYNNGLVSFLLIILLPIYVWNLKIDNYAKLSLIGTFLITTIGLFWGLHFYRYYLLPLFIFSIVGIVSITLILSRILDKVIAKRYSFVLYIMILGLFSFLTYYNANYKEMILMSKDNYFQFKYADYINNKKDKATLLNMGYLDAGLYTTTGIVPNTRFFEVQNIPYDKFPDNLDDMEDNVKNKRIDFILYYTRDSIEDVKDKNSYIFDNYYLVYDDVYLFEHEEYNAYLFEKRE